MLVIGLLITSGFLIGIILLFSYSKFHELLNDLKKEVDNKSKQNQNDLNDLKRQIVEYDQLFKQVNHFIKEDNAVDLSFLLREPFFFSKCYSIVAL